MNYSYKPKGICPIQIDFNIDGDVITNIVFTGGCNGNLKAVSKLVNGWTVDQIENVLSGNTCGRKPTSCADQLAKAAEQFCKLPT